VQRCRADLVAMHLLCSVNFVHVRGGGEKYGEHHPWCLQPQHLKLNLWMMCHIWVFSLLGPSCSSHDGFMSLTPLRWFKFFFGNGACSLLPSELYL